MRYSFPLLIQDLFFVVLFTGEVVMVQDFGENRKAAYSAEIRCSYFGKQQITVHPIVCFYRKGDSVVRESLIFLSDDTTHDHLAVQDFTNLALVELEKSVTITKLTIWSDGAACQYEVPYVLCQN